MPVRIILVEDHDIVRQGVRSLLENEAEIRIVAEASSGQEALELCRKLPVDLALVDLNMPTASGLDFIRQLKLEFPKMKILILSMQDIENYLGDVLQAGASGYILKSFCKSELLFAIAQVTTGKMYISPEFTLSVLEKFKSSFRPSGYRGPAINLTEGENQVLELIADGFTNTQMANKLFISVRTIESRRKKLLEKTGTINTATLIKFCVRHGLVK